jgi:hypothetical protein
VNVLHALDVLDEAHLLGIRLHASQDRLSYAPISKVPPDLRARLQKHKAVLLVLVRHARPYPPGPWCSSCGGEVFWLGERGLNWLCAACSPPPRPEDDRLSIDLSGGDVILSMAVPVPAQPQKPTETG